MQHCLHLYCLIAFFVLGALVPRTLADEPCTARDGDNFYNLSPLRASKDYVFMSPSGEKFTINVCKPVVSETWAMHVDRPKDVAGFIHRPRGDFSIGYTNTTLLVRNGHPLLVTTDGSQCPTADNMTASTAIRFICDTSVFGAGSPELVAQLPPDDDSACAFFVEWRTHVACPTNERGGSWGFLVIVVAILGTVFMLYILVGTWYKRYVLELRGFDQIPRLPMMSFSDMVAFFRDWMERIRDGSWRGGYRGMTEEHESMMGGPPGFLDEQEEEASRDPEAGREGEPTTTPRPPGMDSAGVIRL